MGTSVGAWTFCYHKGTELEQARQARRARRAQTLLENTGEFVEVKESTHQEEEEEEVLTMIMANEEERGKIPAAEQEQLLNREAAAALNRRDLPHDPEKMKSPRVSHDVSPKQSSVRPRLLAQTKLDAVSNSALYC
uniref:Uncharacterized protein n=1 Tax=Plectus sambesii TaxID=2011161 RepID=A0A914WRB3_9BILA